jgi:hypothetical protein
VTVAQVGAEALDGTPLLAGVEQELEAQGASFGLSDATPHTGHGHERFGLAFPEDPEIETGSDLPRTRGPETKPSEAHVPDAPRVELGGTRCCRQERRDVFQESYRTNACRQAAPYAERP